MKSKPIKTKNEELIDVMMTTINVRLHDVDSITKHSDHDDSDLAHRRNLFLKLFLQYDKIVSYKHTPINKYHCVSHSTWRLMNESTR